MGSIMCLGTQAVLAGPQHTARQCSLPPHLKPSEKRVEALWNTQALSTAVRKASAAAAFSAHMAAGAWASARRAPWWLSSCHACRGGARQRWAAAERCSEPAMGVPKGSCRRLPSPLL
jgi:hypothetical protein